MSRCLYPSPQGEAIYRMCEVRGLTEASRPYKLPGADKGQTLILLRVRHGAHENDVRIDKISNHRFAQVSEREALARDRRARER